MHPQSDIYLDRFNAMDFARIIDHPNILIAANFWEADRYGAAKTCYKLMRAIDDLVDDYKSAHPVITEAEQTRLMAEVDQWIRAIAGQKNEGMLSKEILDTFLTYKIPAWPMEAFAKSMLYDIHHDGFASLQAFLDYAEGASVAPAAIFVHLCGLNRTKEGLFTVPAFDVQAAARPCAIFSYLVHIIRDFQKDQFNHLNYFADDLVAENGLDRKKLNEMAHGAPIEKGFRRLIRTYLEVAEDYRQQTYRKIQEISPLLEPCYQLSLEIIFNLYLMVFERIDAEQGSFSTEALNPTPDEVKARVYDTIVRFTQSTVA